MLVAQKERSLLARIAFSLCRMGFLPQAEEIFNGLSESEPERDGSVVGLALCSIIKGQCEAALAMLDQRLAKGSVIAPQLTLYKLLALGMAGRLPEARELRQKMELDGMLGTLKTADILLEDLSRQQINPGTP
jgi:thioredoxin-like negative regulator of GroEL